MQCRDSCAFGSSSSTGMHSHSLHLLFCAVPWWVCLIICKTILFCSWALDLQRLIKWVLSVPEKSVKTQGCKAFYVCSLSVDLLRVESNHIAITAYLLVIGFILNILTDSLIESFKVLPVFHIFIESFAGYLFCWFFLLIKRSKTRNLLDCQDMNSAKQ